MDWYRDDINPFQIVSEISPKCIIFYKRRLRKTRVKITLENDLELGSVFVFLLFYVERFLM